MKLVAMYHRFSHLVNRLGEVMCVVFLSAMVLLTGAQIFCRVFLNALTWSEELTRYLLIWSTFIGSSVVYKQSGHISVTLLAEHLPEKLQKLLMLFVHLVCGTVCVLSVYYGFRYMHLQGNQLSAALRLPMRLMYMSIPVGFLFTLVHIVDALLQLLPVNHRKEVQTL